MAQAIDTSVIIGLERRGLPIDALTDISPDRQGRNVISAITASELLVGVHLASPEGREMQRREFVEDVLNALDVIPFDAPVARTHARLAADLTRMGLPTGPHDLQIAATAVTLGYDLLTDNTRNFANIPGLVVRQPDWPDPAH